MARLLIEVVTLTKTDPIHLYVRFRGGQTTSLTAAWRREAPSGTA